MTPRQKILKLVYPLLIWAKKKGTKETDWQNKQQTPPPVSFHSLSVTLNNGKTLSFAQLKGKKVLLVNTASDCGYTAQYADLQTLYSDAKEKIEIIAFPANDFKEQEKGTDEEIASFCAINYGVAFPIAKKTVVVKSRQQHPVYQWLSNPKLNGWNDKAPSWNFAKYLVNEDGVLTHYFEPAVSPLDAEVRSAMQA
ncbi:MAG TPA: glutathione peroxidase [Flavisolibacter sp.]|nr:glutathione peroxidase [Flavisolibacter sp.]